MVKVAIPAMSARVCAAAGEFPRKDESPMTAAPTGTLTKKIHHSGRTAGLGIASHRAMLDGHAGSCCAALGRLELSVPGNARRLGRLVNDGRPAVKLGLLGCDLAGAVGACVGQCGCL
jgi:hypothetical protein